MSTPVKLPDIGTTGDSLLLVAWLKEEGERVELGEPICEIETDKSTVELESDAEGVLLRHVVAVDSEVEVGTVLAYLGEPGEAVPDDRSEPGSAGSGPST